MDNLTRLQYLKAMGIDVWVSKYKTQKETLSSIDDNATVADAKFNGNGGLIEDKWNALQKTVAEYVKATLCESRAQTVFGVGNKDADWMLISEAPDHNEEGQSGQLLTEMIRAIGLERDSVYITSLLKCKLRDDRNPKENELKACRDFLQQQIQLVQPKIILVTGQIATQTLLETNESLVELRGVAHQLGGIPLFVIYHPAYLLRSLIEKRRAWQDLQLAIKAYKLI